MTQTDGVKLLVQQCLWGQSQTQSRCAPDVVPVCARVARWTPCPKPSVCACCLEPLPTPILDPAHTAAMGPWTHTPPGLAHDVALCVQLPCPYPRQFPASPAPTLTSTLALPMMSKAMTSESVVWRSSLSDSRALGRVGVAQGQQSAVRKNRYETRPTNTTVMPRHGRHVACEGHRNVGGWLGV